MNYIQISLLPHITDVKGEQVRAQAASFLGIDTGEVKCSQVYAVQYNLKDHDMERFAHTCLGDEIMNKVSVDQIELPAENFKAFIAVAKLPGVTDDEGTSAQKALADLIEGNDFDTQTQHIFSQTLYYIEKPLTRRQLKQIAEELLGNKLIHHFQYDTLGAVQSLKLNQLYVPKVRLVTDTTTTTIDLNLADDELLALSKRMVLALNLAEMKAVQTHYNYPTIQAKRAKVGLPASPTDCELEVIAQTWSEHCKHKEFNAVIHFVDKETGEEKQVNSLFKTFIKGSTEKVRQLLQEKGNDWLVKVFTDNAGIVRMNEDTHFVWKVETHNSPSALDPYGGAITGILGNNRDPLATGIGGARLLFNTNVLCFGSPYFDGKLLTGQLHPKRIFSGVRHGIEDGGNKSGIPTVNGSIIFDDRFRGKPLVYCGTGGILKPEYNGRPTFEKLIDPGDRIIMAGGRVGKDGIHGATFSSIEIDEHSPMSAVQIGSPITQKLMADFMIRACEQGLIKSSTDNGAGGLSSSIGELATITNGALVQLEKVPLKYSGLRPWEIFVSESQERMSLVVTPENKAALFQLAEEMEVELTDIGHFSDDGNLDIRFGEQRVALIDMEFLHDGVPQKVMYAEWEKPDLLEPIIQNELDHEQILIKLLGSLNICSREWVIRQYDHEVKGKTVVKPLMGETGKAPQDAAVVRLGFGSYEGVAVSNGICPQYGDIDPYEMSAGAFDEAVRQIISVGGTLPNQSVNDGICWSVNDNFCVPDSEFHPTNNPDGKLKLAKLVRMCEALYDMSTYFQIPMTSGKDSMKNDYKGDGVRISIPPTILYSMTAKVDDIRRTVTSNFKAIGDRIYLLGDTYNELGASEFYKLFGEVGTSVPKVRKEAAYQLYQKVSDANREGWIESCHDCSDGGMIIALAECLFGGQLGCNVNVDGFREDLSLLSILYAESHSRFVVSIAPENQAAFETHFGDAATYLGNVIPGDKLLVSYKEEEIINQSISDLIAAWEGGLAVMGAIA